MRVVVRSSTTAELVVESPVGQLAGVWRENRHRPQVGQAIDVEFTIDWVVRAEDAIVESGAGASLRWDSVINRIVGCIEAVDPDGMGFLRLAPDSLSMIDTDGLVVAGAWVQLSVPCSAVEIYGYVV